MIVFSDLCSKQIVLIKKIQNYFLKWQTFISKMAILVRKFTYTIGLEFLTIEVLNGPDSRLTSVLRVRQPDSWEKSESVQFNGVNRRKRRRCLFRTKAFVAARNVNSVDRKRGLFKAMELKGRKLLSFLCHCNIISII